MMPSKVELEEHEVVRITRIRVARYFGKLPHEVDQMPYQDYVDAVAVMNADYEVQEARAQARQAQRNLKGFGKK